MELLTHLLYEDEFCFCINKPNNLLVHHSHFARNIEDESLVQLLKEAGFESPIPVHRLDRKTSGVILFSKSKAHVKLFQSLFEMNAMTKQYVALLRGFVVENQEIDSPVKNEKGNYKDAKSSLVPIRCVELNIAVAPYATARYSYVYFYPTTGRTHQLRIHANKISHPIIGDPKHGNRHHNHMFEQELQLPNLFLHAKALTFKHPYTNETIHIEAPLPHFWSQFDEQTVKHSLLKITKQPISVLKVIFRYKNNFTLKT
jgi:tRNA pseudouridine65 synthase